MYLKFQNEPSSDSISGPTSLAYSGDNEEVRVLEMQG